MSTPLALVARTALAACGIALIAAAARPLGRSANAPGRAQRSAAWESLLAAVAGTVAPLAARSDLLMRAKLEPVVRRRLALVGTASWVARAARIVAIRGARPGRRARSPAFRRPTGIAGAMASLRGACALAALAVALPLAWLAGPFVGALALLAALATAALPDAALAAHARRAERRVDLAMPAALELLAACCRGGIALESALAVTAAHTREPLGATLDRARQRQRAGEPPASALRVEAETVGLPEVGAIGRLVERHHQLGLPLEGPLLARAQAARARARIAALARAGRGVPLASLLVATVIAPCCVAVLATWVILAALGQAGLA